MKNALHVCKLLISILFLSLILRVVQGSDFMQMLKEVDPPYLLISVALSVMMVAISCLKWYVLLAHQGSSVSYSILLQYYLIGYYFTTLLPSNMGGDAVRSYYAGRRIGSQTRAAVSVFIERISGLIFLLFLVAAAPMLHPRLYRHSAIWIPALWAICVFGTWIVLNQARQLPSRIIDAVHWRRGSSQERSWAPRIERFISFIRGKADRFRQKLISALRDLKSDRRVWAPVGLLTVLFYFLTWVNVYVTFRAFGVKVPFFEVAALVPACLLVAMIPIAPLASLGLAEGAYVFYFGLVGVLPAESLAMGLFLRCKLLLIGLIGLGIHLTHGQYIKERMSEGNHA